MTLDPTQLVRESWGHLAGAEDRLAERFYARLFEIAPASAALFGKTDMGLQRRKFTDMLDEIVRHADRPEAMFGELKGLAERHVGYRVHAADYALVGDALLHALGESLGDRFTAEVRQAWAEAYRLTAAVMIRAHEKAGGPK